MIEKPLAPELAEAEHVLTIDGGREEGTLGDVFTSSAIKVTELTLTAGRG